MYSLLTWGAEMPFPHALHNWDVAQWAFYKLLQPLVLLLLLNFLSHK